MTSMPSPLGHALGGIAVAWAADLFPGRRPCAALQDGNPDQGGREPVPSRREKSQWTGFYRRAGGACTLACAALAVSPDLDLVLTSHRTATHSLTAAALVAILAAAVTGWVTRGRLPTGRVALMCGAAYAGHLLLDWLAIDRTPPYGLQILWPFSQTWFISGADLFLQTERRQFLSVASIRTNLLAMAWESAILLPVLAGLWLVRVKTLARLAAQATGGDHAAQKRARPVL
jgi:membrane-bound metal-dependent hydrolase YbcI (DUF457 family)